MKKYQIIYADPPWRYDFCKDNSDKIEVHYPTMTNEDICKIEVPSEDNSVLYLWATAPKLLEALAVMKAWGFTYKTQQKRYGIYRKRLLVVNFPGRKVPKK